MQTASLTAVLTLAAVWLATHRYFGIQHDGLYYAVQALARLDPAAYRHDLFFAFGSQDDYSLFGRLYADMADILGLGRAAFLLLVTAHLAWMLAAWALARQWLASPARWIGLALVFALPGHYGSQADAAHDILRYAESFLTARSFAEPLVLASVAAACGGRPRLALAAVAAALAIHPIMALPGLLFLALFHLRPAARQLAALAGLAALAAFALPAMDDAWLAEVRRHARYVMLDTWSWGELAEPLAWIGILFAAASLAAAPLQRAWRALALAGAAGLYLALLGTVSHAALLIQAQPWRCLWLVKIAALLALASLFADRWRRSAADRWLLAGLAAAALTAPTLGGPVALALALLARLGWRDGVAPAPPRWLPAAGALALAVVLLETALAMLQQLGELARRLAAWADPSDMLPKGDLAAFFQGPLALLLPLALAALLRAELRHPRAALAAAALCLGLAAAGWQRADARLEAALFSGAAERPFGALIGRHETVYWQNNLLQAWFGLRQANYASKHQAVSALFSREAALESGRRLARLAAFGSVDAGPPADGRRAASADFAKLCEDRLLDAAILAHRIGEINAPRWRDPRGGDWYLHRCPRP